jgi:hypothetical protein
VFHASHDAFCSYGDDLGEPIPAAGSEDKPRILLMGLRRCAYPLHETQRLKIRGLESVVRHSFSGVLLFFYEATEPCLQEWQVFHTKGCFPQDVAQ